MHDGIFNHDITFDPSAEFDAFLKQLPAKWAVYLLADAEDRPMQLLCVKNLRYSVERRLGRSAEEEAPSKRVNYRDLVRRIFWRRVDSSLEADLVYLLAARALFPQAYQNMIGFRPAWFVHVDPEALFPRYVKTTDLSEKRGTYLGPLEEKQVATKLIEQVEDWFDLCRYHHILVEAPDGRACAYRDMGKCPAPCDDSISMESYRHLIRWSLQTLIDPAEMLRTQQNRMSDAAAELRFEVAGKIKAFVDQLSQLGKGPYRHLHRLEDFCYLSLQRGPKEGLARVFVVTPGEVIEVAGLLCEPSRLAEIMRLALESAQRTAVVDDQAIERIGIVTHHLFQPKAKEGIFLHLSKMDETSILKAYRDLRKQKAVEEIGEGVVKEGGTGVPHVRSSP